MIAILMATYNGERFLREQIDSILTQTYKDWHLYIHDDGSKDATPAILKEYEQEHPDLITVMDYPPQGGPLQNFMSLLERIDAPYYMFSDQDDVWLADKIESEMNAMKANEKDGLPVIVATDLIVVDEHLKTIAPSLWQIAGIYPELITSFDDMAANTVVTGCTMLFNATLRKVVIPVSPHATMHDAWMACCLLKNNGTMVCLHDKTILYRQHGDNTLGAQDVSSKSIWSRLRSSWQINRAHYAMLDDMGYGSWIKYISHKIKYRKGISKLHNA